MRILRLSVILSLRRADEVLPQIKVSVEQEKMLLHLPDGWLDQNPLSAAELYQEAKYQAAHGWQLEIL